MDNAYQNRLEQEVTEIIYADILRGKININTPIGNLKDLPVQVKNLTDKGIVYQPFETEDNSRQSYNYAVSALENFTNHLRANRVTECLAALGVKKPRPTHKYLYDKSPMEPKLNSFMSDQKIIVCPVQKVGRKYDIELDIPQSNGMHHVRFEYNLPQISATVRGYEVKPNQDNPDAGTLEAVRTPALFSGNSENELGKIAGLSLEVMCSLLEPATTARIIRKYNDTVDSRFNGPQEYIDFLFRSGIKEERTLAKAIVQDWLKAGYGDKEHQMDLSLGFDSGWTSKKEVEKSHEQIDEAGVLDTISYYYSNKWNFEKFLDGSFKDLLVI
ncbi:MAG: hypothetical protein WC402_00965 [Candidatus Pacearchaeota archaeon]|jgi:hypothetical protein